MIKAAIFDMDGLLIDSEPFWRASHVEVLASHDVHVTVDDVKQMMGRRIDEVVAHWKENHPLDHVPNADIENAVIDSVIRMVEHGGQRLPGVQHVLEMMQEHDIPMAVASSSSPEIIETVMEVLDLSKYMELTHSGKYEEFGKPHPAVFITTAKNLGVLPGECVVFEDSPHGVTAAKAAGMICVAVPETDNKHLPIYRQADLVVDSLADLSWPAITALVR